MAGNEQQGDAAGTAIIIGHRAAGKPQVRKQRRDAFTAAKQDAFFAQLHASCNIGESARLAGVSPNTVWTWRRKNPAFAQRYAAVLADAHADLEMRLMAIARHGVTGEQWDEVGEDGVVRQCTRRDAPGVMQFLLTRHQAAATAAGVGAVAAAEAERAPRETLDELIDRLAARLNDAEAEEAGEDGAAR